MLLSVDVREVEIPFASDCSDNQAERAITQSIGDSGLRVTLLGTLEKYPGCIHWHLKRGTERGTLEITFWPKGHRAWFTIQTGRTGEWIETVIPKILSDVQSYMLDAKTGD